LYAFELKGTTSTQFFVHEIGQYTKTMKY